MSVPIRKIAFAAIIGAAYAALTIFMAPISFGLLQLRLTEALCILPFFFPYSTWGLFIGCLIANLLSPFGILDIIFGSVATLLACICTMLIGKYGKGHIGTKILACVPPVIINGVIIGALISYTSTPALFAQMMLAFGLQIAAEEFAVLFALGLPLLILLPKAPFFKRLQMLYSK